MKMEMKNDKENIYKYWGYELTSKDCKKCK